jgi:hypothetical protein
MNTLKAIGLYVFLVIAFFTFFLSSCQVSKQATKNSCCAKKATVDNCTKTAKKSECCKH